MTLWMRGFVAGAVVGYALRVLNERPTSYYSRLRARLHREEGIPETASTSAAAEG